MSICHNEVGHGFTYVKHVKKIILAMDLSIVQMAGYKPAVCVIKALDVQYKV